MGAGVRVSGAFALGVWALGLLGARGGACGCGEVGVGVAWVAGGVGALAGGGLRPPFLAFNFLFNNSFLFYLNQHFLCCTIVYRCIHSSILYNINAENNETENSSATPRILDFCDFTFL
jgi:hypothetical protein